MKNFKFIEDTDKTGFFFEIADAIRFEALKAHMNRYLHEWGKIEAANQDLYDERTIETLGVELSIIKSMLPATPYDGDIHRIIDNEIYSEAVDKVTDQDGSKHTMFSELDCIYLACKRFIELWNKGDRKEHLKELNQLQHDLHELTDVEASAWTYGIM